ncbi:MAG: T9SS type A sorting domain-containing protein [Balneolales bacterium]|nr:T9SS type A sorting domain-containing protein [Balneolales bacterium]
MRTYIASLLFITILFLGFTSLTTTETSAQTVSIGNGSYSTTLPPGTVGPSTSAGEPASPKITESFDKPIVTNDFWSSLIFPFNGDPHSNYIYAHPLNFKAESYGLKIGYTPTHVLSGNDYLYPFSEDLMVGVAGLSATETVTKDYGDWTVTALWEDESASMEATIGHGLPYSFFTISGGNALVTSAQTPEVWHNENEVLGVTINGNHYGIFAPTGSSWSGTNVFESSLNGKDYFSVALLPDTTSATLEVFRERAYAFVTNTVVEWEYNEATAEVTTTYSYETFLMDSSGSNSSETLTALYRHQWLNTSEILTSYTYASPRGMLKLFQGNSFTTQMMFSGILPSLPDAGSYDRIQLLEFVQDVTDETLSPIASTYNSGKEMGRFAELVHIADQLGAVAERDYFLSELKIRLEDWLTVGNGQEYVYNSTWNSLTGYPSGFGADRELNDQHFHAGYAVKAAATVAQYDSAWAAQENWGGMVNLLIKNASNWDRDDTQFPFLRNHDVYAGHSWASGHADFEAGNNQESSSESMNFSAATFLWGEITNQEDIRDLGVFLYTTETAAIEQYWFDVDDEVFPSDYTKDALGLVWGNKGVYGTWFGSAPEFIHGINFLPVTSASVYLGRHPAYIIENYNLMVSELGGQPTQWKDVLWSFLALSDADLAISYYEGDPDYEPFDGESRARTYHWLYNLKEMGHFNTDVFADISTYAVFVNENDDTTYVAYNSGLAERLVTFSDGFEMMVPANSTNTHSTAIGESSLTAAPVPDIDASNVISIFSDTYPSITEAQFNVDEGQSTIITLEIIEGNNTLKYDNLDFQTTLLANPQNVSSRDSFHVDYFSGDVTLLAVYLVDGNESEGKFDFTVTTDTWQSVNIPLSVFSDSVDLTSLSEIRFEGDGTVYVDNLYFSGSEPVPTGPQIAAPVPVPDSENVISIFSDSYTNVEGTDFNPNWNQSTIASVVMIGEDSLLKYEGLNYQGTELGDTLDVSEMGWFHLDYWTSDATELEVYLISPGPLETPYELTVRTNEWQSIDIPLSEFSDVVNLTEVFQLKIEGNGTIFFDNFYFGKNPELIPAPIPTHDADKVVSLFSNSYPNIDVDTWSAVWDQANLEDISLDGDDIKFYSNLNHAGIEFISEQIDATNLTNFRFDMWTSQPTGSPARFSVKLVDFGANGVWSGGDDVEDELFFDATSTPALVSNQWISFDLPIDDFENMVTREHLSQLLFIASGGLQEIYIDNVYFYGDQVLSSNENESEIPSEVILSQNYPNPFNPSTNIEFGIPEASGVSLEIYNSIGQKVATLVNERLSAGSYSFTWNASQMSSGVYFYRLQSGDVVSTKKMLLIK